MINTPTLKSSFCLGATLIALSVCTSACSGSGSLVTGAQISTSTQNGDQWVTVDLDLNTWSLTLPSLSLPIGGEDVIGDLSLTGKSGSAVIQLSADINRIADIDATNVQDLPNGTPIPVTGAANVQILGIPLSDGITIYVSLSATELMLGAAIPIAEFGTLPGFLPGLNFFPSFNIGKVQGVAGIYAGSANGIAFFVDGSALLPPVTSSALTAKSEVQTTSKLKFSGVVPNANEQSNMENQLYSLGEKRRGRPLTVGN